MHFVVSFENYYARNIREFTCDQHVVKDDFAVMPTTTNKLLLPAADSIIECFECNSWDDPRCHDPFNRTIHKHDMPPLVDCEGCCVKRVQFIGTGKDNHIT